MRLTRSERVVIAIMALSVSGLTAIGGALAIAFGRRHFNEVGFIISLGWLSLVVWVVHVRRFLRGELSERGEK